MDEFKIKDFEEDHPGQKFPAFRSLSDSEARKIAERLALKVGLHGVDDSLALVMAVCDGSPMIQGINAQDRDFDLEKVVKESGVRSKKDVYINWYRFDIIDSIALIDLSRTLEYIWWPGPDDIDVFDDTLTWVLSIDHGGFVKLKQLPP